MKFDKLKFKLCFILWLVLPILSFGKDNTEALFAKGNALYARGQYTGALDAYRQILNEGYQSVAVYFNMGNSSYKNGDIASALLYYEKAHKLAPGDEDINFNINFANLKTTDKIDEAPEFFLTNWWKTFILGFSVNTLAVLSVLAVLCGSAVLIVYFFANSVSIKKLSFYTSIILFFIGIITIFITNQQISYFNGHRKAIIFSNSVTVKSGPVDQSANLFVIHDGTKVTILENDNGWLRIGLANGNKGWIKQSDAKEI
jgi:tetratricopeptide (TPR) repeat protein